MKENDLEKEDKTGGFRVKDRRRFDSDGNERPESVAGPAEVSKPAAPQATTHRNGTQEAAPRSTPKPDRQEALKPDRQETREEPSVSFSSLIMSLAHQALLHLGLTESVHGGTRQVDKGAAKETIDILSMLEMKTRGNLDEEEERMIQEILHELRITYVRVAK